MNTQQLISFLAETLGCEENAAEKCVAAIVRWLTGQLAENGQLLIPGFGRFEVSKKMEYVRCDANSNKRFLVPPSLSADFVPAPLLDETDEPAKKVFAAISEMLVDEEKTDKYLAERFPVTFFKGILDAMERGETVSVPQLGTFLLTKVRVAENIFGKVSFTPDAALSEWVNRPFSYLPEVELNEGVEFDDIKTVTPYDNIHEQPEEDKTFLILTESAAPAESPENQEDQDTPESPESQGSLDPLDSLDSLDTLDTLDSLDPSASPDEPAAPPASSEPPSAPEPPAPSPARSRFWMYALPLLALVIGLISLLLHLRRQDDGIAQTEQTAQMVDSLNGGDTMKVAEVEDVTQVAAPADTINYEAMNAQIPYGAYDIVGIDTVITVMPGQNLATISRIFLGTDIHIYLIVANNGNDNPKEGEKYRIPRLKLRK